MTTSLADTFADRPVFLTGHTGFKGSWLALWMSELGAKVTGYALAPPTEPNNFTLSRVRDLLAHHHEADIRDGAQLAQTLDDANPDVIFHLAAQSIVRESFAQPRETLEINTIGIASLLDAVRLRGRACVVVIITSDKCYRLHDAVGPCREDDPLGGDDPYSASKGAAEIVAASYRHSFFPPARLADHGVKLATARAGNVIGGGDWARDRIVTDIVRCLAEGQPIPIRNPQAIRPWQHVLEPLHGYLTLAARMLTSSEPIWCDAWNFGPTPDDNVPVEQLVDRFIAAWGHGLWEDQGNQDCPPEAQVLRLAIDKVADKLGWRPRWDLSTAVDRTAAWYRRFHEDRHADMRQACLEDIAAYATTPMPLGGSA